MHTAAYRALGLDFTYVAIHVDPGEVGAALDHLAEIGYTGVNVTVPHKFEALEWCKAVEPFASRAGAVNTINLATRAGINTDGPGFMRACAEALREPCDVLMLGAGGSARAIAIKIVDAGHRLTIWNRTASRAEDLVRDLGKGASVAADTSPANSSVIINATSGSLGGDALSIAWSEASSDPFVVDLMYTDGLTPFLSAAQAAGLDRLMDGRPLLMEQGALAFEYWTGKVAPREAMLEAIAK